MTKQQPGGASSDDLIEDTAWDFPVRAVVSAALARPLSVAAPRSIFELAARADAGGIAAPVADDVAPPVAISPRVLVDGRVMRVTGRRYPDNRWTEERAEIERARRAKQRPPKPVRGAKTRGKKLLELIGEAGPDA